MTRYKAQPDLHMLMHVKGHSIKCTAHERKNFVWDPQQGLWNNVWVKRCQLNGIDLVSQA